MLASFMSYLQLVKQDPREQWASERIKNAAWRGKQINIFVYLYMYEVYDTIRIHIQKQRYSLLLLFSAALVYYRRALCFLCTGVCVYVFLYRVRSKKNEEMLDNNKFPRRPISHQIFVSSLGDDGKHEMSRQLSWDDTQNPTHGYAWEIYVHKKRGRRGRNSLLTATHDNVRKWKVRREKRYRGIGRMKRIGSELPAGVSAGK